MKIFFAYEREDQKYFDELLEHFAVSIRNEQVDIWHTGMINAGDRIDIEIERNLNNADVVVFILSADFLASDLFLRIEDEVIRKVKNKSQTIIPILYRPCTWKSTNFASFPLQALPKNGKWLSGFSKGKREAENLKIAQAILHLKPTRKQEPRQTKENKNSAPPVHNKVQSLNRRIRTLAIQNKVDQAIEELDSIVEHSDNKEIRNTAILLKSRYNQALRDQRIGVFTNENEAGSKDKIMISLISQISDIPKEIRAGSLEESEIFLDSIKRTSGFEDQGVKLKGTRRKIYDTDEDIDSIFDDLDTKHNINEIPALKKKADTIKKEYDQRKGKDSGNANNLRGQLNSLVDEIQAHQSEVQRKKASKDIDFSAADIVYLNEAKLILVGNGGVGKTTLKNNLINASYQLTKHKSTPGLEVDKWDFPLIASSATIPGVSHFRFNIWDFGGQGKYRALQQFFCTSNALYLFVTSPNEEHDIENDDYVGFEYWLNYIRLHSHDKANSKESPVIFIMNKADLPAYHQLDMQKLMGAYKNVPSFIHVSCKTGMGIDDTRIAIEDRLMETGMVNRSFPKSWLQIKNLLSELAQTQNLIDYDEYLKTFKELVPETSADFNTIQNIESQLMGKNEQEVHQYLDAFYKKVNFSTINQYYEKVKETDDWERKVAGQIIIEQKADTLIKYLHAAGIVLFYPRVRSLNDKIILNPDWARELAYEIMDSRYAKNGVLREEDLIKIFPGEERQYSIDLLTSFNLCYEFRMRQETKYILPSLFSFKRPDGFPDFNKFQQKFVYQCEFSPLLPADLLAKLIALHFELVTNSSLYWKYGVVLMPDGETIFDYKCMALIKENWRENNLTVYLIGNDWQELLCLISNSIHSIIEQNQFSSSSIQTKEKLGFKPATGSLAATSFRSITEIRENASSKKLTSATLNPLIAEIRASLAPPSIIVDPPPTSNGQKTLLFLTACPENKSPVQFGPEFRAIQDARKESDAENKIEIEQIPSLKANELSMKLFQTPNDIVHISVHGKRNENLIFVDENNNEALISLDEFGDVIDHLKKHQKLPEILALLACHSYPFAKRASSSVRVTIGIEGTFPAEAAPLFANVFYSYYFLNGDYEYAFKLAVRAIERRKFMPQNDKEIHTMPSLFLNYGKEEFNFNNF